MGYRLFTRFLITFALSVLTGNFIQVTAQELPIGYISYYKNPCSDKGFLDDLTLNRPDEWKIDTRGQCASITPSDSGDARIPQSRGILREMIFGEYIMEFEFRITGEAIPADSAGFYFLNPVKGCDDYYALGFCADSLYFFSRQGDSISLLDSKKTELDYHQWTKVRVKRDMLKRRLTIRLDGKNQETHEFFDRRLVMGYIGFGAQTVNCSIRNVRIWAPTAFQDQILNCE